MSRDDDPCFEALAEQEERAYRKEMDTLRWAGEAVELSPLPRYPRTCVIMMTPRDAEMMRRTELQEDEARDQARYIDE